MTTGPHDPVCYLAAHGVVEQGDPMPPCEGRLIRAHLIPKRLIQKMGGEMWDARGWVYACGGVTGCGGHHGMLDVSRRLRLPRSAIPECVEELAAELVCGWFLDREYGERAA